MGLGLAYVKKIIEIHNGRIEVKSKKGQGTTFILKLPRTH
jgi:two-component system phosphate regulon sensor histidine kinase PhoR